MPDQHHGSLPVQQPKRTAMLCVRLTEQEHRCIYEFARQHNLQVSRLVRHFVLKGIQHHSVRRSAEPE